jgi:hypothetical protein
VSLSAALRPLRRALRRRRAVSSLAGAAGLVLLAWPLALAFAPVNAWALALARVLPLVGAAGLVVYLGWVFAETADDLALVRMLGPPSLRSTSALLTAVELERLLAFPAPPFSPVLARAHIAQTARGALPDLERSVRDQPARGWILLLAGGAVAAGSLALAPGLLLGGLRALSHGSSAVGAETTASADPITLDLQLTYIFPAYMGLTPRVVSSSNGAISAPPGTEVQLQTRADREVGQAFVVVDGQSRALSVAGGRDLKGSMIISRPGSYHFRFANSAGQVLIDGPPIPIAVEPDLPPRVSIYSPGESEEVEPRAIETIRYGADDDYGLSHLDLVFRIGGSKADQRRPLPLQPGGVRHVLADYSWDLGALSLGAGDQVSYWLEATDNDTVSGPNVARSKHHLIRAFSEAEHHRAALERVERLWKALVDQLADTLEAPEVQKPQEADFQAGATLEDHAFELSRKISETARELRRDTSSPAEIHRALANVAAGLHAQSQVLSDARLALLRWTRSGTPDSPGRRRFDAALKSEVEELEKDAIYLEKLLDHRRIEDLQALAKDLSARRRDLAKLLEQFQRAPDEATRAAIQTNISRLKERMGELLRRMGELSRNIQDQHLNLDAAKEMDKSGSLISSLDKVQDLINQGKADEAMKALQALGDKMDDMEAGLGKAKGGFAGREDPELSKSFSKFTRDLQDVAEGEKSLAAKTKAVRDADRDELTKNLAAKGEDFANRLRARVSESRAILRELPVEPTPTRFSFGSDLAELAARARESLDSLDRALAGRDFSAADEAANQAVSSTQQLAGALRDDVERPRSAFDSLSRGPQATEKAAQSANQALAPLTGVKRELDGLFPHAGDSLTPQQQSDLNHLAGEQGALRAKQEEVRREMDELGSKAPIFSQKLKESLRSAGTEMEGAESSLSTRDPAKAVAQESAAADRLEQVRKGLQGGKSGAGGGSPLLLPSDDGSEGGSEDPGDEGEEGERQREEPVEIPAPGRDQVPAEYRKEIMDAMKQSAPSRYKDQVKEYYEEIVK